LIRNSPGKRERIAAWCRGRTGLIALTLCVAFILVFVGISLINQASLKNNLESFDCRHSSSSQAFSIEVEVELSDGMDQDEAVSTAVSAMEKVLFANPEMQIGIFGMSADLDRDGLWLVKLKLAQTITTWYPGHWGVMGSMVIWNFFEAIIDPINRTVVYSFV